MITLVFDDYLDQLGETYDPVKLERYAGFGQWKATLGDVVGYGEHPLKALMAAEAEANWRRVARGGWAA